MFIVKIILKDKIKIPHIAEKKCRVVEDRTHFSWDRVPKNTQTTKIKRKVH
jgi:hypothetical protein